MNGKVCSERHFLTNSASPNFRISHRYHDAIHALAFLRISHPWMSSISRLDKISHRKTPQGALLTICFIVLLSPPGKAAPNFSPSEQRYLWTPAHLLLDQNTIIERTIRCVLKLPFKTEAPNFSPSLESIYSDHQHSCFASYPQASALCSLF